MWVAKHVRKEVNGVAHSLTKKALRCHEVGVDI